jgi:molybdate transport system regulatory protein
LTTAWAIGATGPRAAATIGFMAHLKITLVLASGARIGPGKAALLESVQATGSISAAARAMGMDYKRAWLLVDSLNRAFDIPVVQRAIGGAGGGGATLTPFGADLLARYRRLEAAAAATAADDLEAMERHALPEAGPKI